MNNDLTTGLRLAVAIPTDSAATMAFAAHTDRRADACLANGFTAQAERLAHVAYEARCRVTRDWL